MHLEDKDETALKKWVVQRIGKIYDADPEVLAEYTVALVQDSDDTSAFRGRAKDELGELLHEQTSDFVETLYSALLSGSYRPKQPRPPPPSNDAGQSRKRSSSQFEGGQTAGNDGITDTRGLRAAKSRRSMQHEWGGAVQYMNTPNNYGAVDNHLLFPFPQNGYAHSMGFQDGTPASMGFQNQPPAFPGYAGTLNHFNPGAPTFEPSPAPFRDPLLPGEPCYAYATFGFCAFGPSCPYRHDVAPSLNHLSLGPGAHNGDQPYRPTRPERSGGHSKPSGTRGQYMYPNNKPRKKAAIKRQGVRVVMEHVPEDQAAERYVRDALSHYGSVQSIDVDYEAGLAYVAFETHDEAARAVSNPHVHWDSTARNGSEAPPADQAGADADAERAATMRRIAEAQIRHSARTAYLAAREELETRIRAQEAERQRILRLLALKQSPDARGEAAADGAAPDAEETDALRAKLAQLRAEASSLGLQSDGSRPHRPLLRFSGWQQNPAMPVGKSAWSTAPRVWAPPSVPRAERAVKRLDLRPKAVRITLRPGDGRDGDAGDAAPARLGDRAASKRLRAFLQGVGPHALLRASGDGDAVVAAFGVRYLAEKFVDLATQHGTAAPRVPGVGRVELAWVRADAAAADPGADVVRIEDDDEDDGEEEEDDGRNNEGEAGIPAAPEQQQHVRRWSPRPAAQDVDLDVD